MNATLPARDVSPTTLDSSTPEPKPAPIASAPSEFKITVRKLEIPVRPRGVLAE